jgi:hypothetical protein
MANEQHLAWLKEGVEAWNARRARDDFIPDLSEANLLGADLFGPILGRAILGRANLRGRTSRRRSSTGRMSGPSTSTTAGSYTRARRQTMAARPSIRPTFPPR